MNMDFLWGPLTLVACAATLVVAGPYPAPRVGCAAYAESQEAWERLVWPPQRPAAAPSALRIPAQENTTRPIRPAA